jgi:chemotaxis protein MotA
VSIHRLSNSFGIEILRADALLNLDAKDKNNDMMVIVGLLVVVASIIGGYLMEKGNLMVLMQPAELVIIGGAAAGTALIANPMRVVKGMVSGMIRALKGSPYDRAYLMETLKMMYEFFSHVTKVGVQAIEGEVDNPEKSPVLSKYPKFLGDKAAVAFLCDTIRTYSSGATSHHQLDHLMEIDIEAVEHEDQAPVMALATVSDSLPGLGIVAAVLGVVITMSALGGPPEEIGHKVAAALVGTFLGILLCYGVIGPISSNMAKVNEGRIQYLQCLRQGILPFLHGSSPILAVEFARRSIASDLRPTFKELEDTCRGAKK